MDLGFISNKLLAMENRKKNDVCGYSVFMFIVVLASRAADVTCQTSKDSTQLLILMPQMAEYDRFKSYALNVDYNYRRLARRNDLSYKILNFGRSPSDIFDLLCTEITGKGTNAILYLHLLDDPKSEALDEYLIQIISHMGLPVMYWNPNYDAAPETNEQNRILQLSPTLYHQVAAIMEVLHVYNWTHISLVSTTAVNYKEFIDATTKLVQENNNFKGYPRNPEMVILKSITYPVDDSLGWREETKAIKTFLKKENHKDSRIYVIHASGSRTKSILDAAEELGLTGAGYLWILTANSVRSVGRTTSLPRGAFGITYRGEASSDDMIHAVFNGTKNSIISWIDAMSDQIQSGVPSSVLTPNFTCNGSQEYWDDGQILYSALKQTAVSDNKYFPQEFSRSGMNKYVRLNVLNVQESPDYPGRNTWVKIGEWLPVTSSSQSVTMELHMSGIVWPGGASRPPTSRPEKRFFRIVTTEEEPYVMFKDPDENTGKCTSTSVECRLVYIPEVHGNDSSLHNGTVRRCCTGLSIDLLNILSTRMNFDYTIFEAPDRTQGVQNPTTGEWNGLIRVLVDKQADLAITALQITPRRSNAITFSMPYLETGTTIIVSLRKGAISPTAVLEPYDYPSWCLILVFSVHSIGASIFIFEWLSPKGLDQGRTPMREHTFSLFRSFWLIWAMLFGASVSADNPRGISSRFLANVWALFALVFLASYTANLAAFMITKTVYYDLSGIKDWRLRNPHSHKPQFKFATVPNGSTEENLRQNHPEMYQYMTRFNKRTVKDAIKALKSGEIQAFIYDATPLEYQVGIDPDCNLISVGKWYAMTGYAVGMQKGSDALAEEVNSIILDLQEYGEIDRLRKFWLSGACHSKKKIGQSSTQLEILNFTSAFILLASGIILSGLLLILEHLYFRFGRKCLKEYDKCGCCALVSLSMGKSLTFEQSVMEAIDFSKKHRCKDPVCETQLWKVRHQLDIALLRVDKLNKEIRSRKSANAVLPLKGGDDSDPVGAKEEELKVNLWKEEEAKKDKVCADIHESDQSVPLPSDPDTTGSRPPETNAGTVRSRDRSLRRSPSYNQAVGSVDDDSDVSGHVEGSKTKYKDGKQYQSIDTENP